MPAFFCVLGSGMCGRAAAAWSAALVWLSRQLTEPVSKWLYRFVFPSCTTGHQ